MRRTLLVLFVVCWATISLVVSASASGYIDSALNALKNTSVYVAPGTESTDEDTQAALLRQLNNNDSVVIVMMPNAAASEVGSDLSRTAIRFDTAAGGNRIVAMTVGETTFAYSAYLPTGTASDLMHRAETVSSSTTETLVTFVQNVHAWQSAHPVQTPPAPEPTAQPESEDSPISTWPIVPVGLAVVVGAVVFFRKRRAWVVANDVYTSPEPVRELLERIRNLSSNIQDSIMVKRLHEVLRDTDNFFNRQQRRGKGNIEDIQMFRQHLEDIESVLRRYIDVQNFPRYYDGPEAILKGGKEAIDGFGIYVLTNIRRTSEGDMLDYSVDTKILSATRDY